MRVEVHVKTIEAIAAAKEAAAQHLSDGDELVVIVDYPVSRPAERQDLKAPR